MAKGKARSGAEAIEWLLGGLSGAVILALVVTLVRSGLADGGAPPLLALTAEPPEAGILRFSVRNDGGSTATDVALRLRLGDGPERRLVIDYVPAHSERSGAFLLPPGAGPAEIVVEGYLDP